MKHFLIRAFLTPLILILTFNSCVKEDPSSAGVKEDPSSAGETMATTGNIYTLGALVAVAVAVAVAVDPMLAILPFLVVQLTGRNSSMYIPTIVGLSLPGMRN